MMISSREIRGRKEKQALMVRKVKPENQGIKAKREIKANKDQKVMKENQG